MINQIENSVIKLLGVSKVYANHSNKYFALENVNLTVSKGELVLLLGPSGSGKTTLLTIAAGFTKPTSGEVLLFGKKMQEYSQKNLQLTRAQKIGFIFQTFLLIDTLSVYANVELVLRFSKNKLSDKKEITCNALEKVGMLNLAKKRPGELSHGERQRTAIARAFANDADLLIADEPTASLESKQGEEIIRLLHSYVSELNKCVVVASHDFRLKPLADRIINIENGRIKSDEYRDKMISQNSFN
jgi:putative ABC transport system ATP-binding protein